MKKIFIDGGARIGETIDMLLNKREDLKGCDAYLFECNPNHKSTLEEIAKSNKDYNFFVRDEAVWVENGEMNLFISKDIWGDLGCTLDPSKKEKLDLQNPILVKTINFSEFLLSFDKDDYIIVKLDIEGAEYEVVESILNSDAINMINELYIEWHDHFFVNKNSNMLKSRLAQYNIKIDNNWV
jgi:FkbM family methyltransferase